MSRVVGLTEALRLRGGNRSLHEALFLCSKELFGLTREEFALRWRPRNSSDKGTLRGYMQPTAEALFTEWKEKRDPAWLYSHPEYKWDSIGCSVCQSCDTTKGGVTLLRKADIKPRLAFDWGAGPGFTSFVLAANFPDCEVHYNELNPELVRVFEWFQRYARLKNLKHVTEMGGDYDLIQAYEIAEHILAEGRPGVGDPVTETAKVLGKTTDVASFLHSSCWSAENRYFTLGHFLRSVVDGQVVKNTRVGMHFRNAMARRGWESVGTGWNSRPTLFRKG